MTYHINPETGRPNICRASIRECRYGSSSEHFETKDVAQQHSEKRMSETFGTVSTLKKVSEVSSLSVESKSEVKSLDQIRKELGVLPEEEMRSLLRERVRHSMSSRELERFDDDKQKYASETFHGYYRRLEPMSLDYKDPDTVQTFMKGACGLIAFEINKVTDFPIVAFSRDSDAGWSGHAVVKLPNGEYFDITGASPRNSVISEFPNSDTWSENEVTPKEFNKMMGIKGRKTMTDSLDQLEKAALAKICFDLITDYNLNDPEKAGEEN